jgi:hypothetical protein
VLDRAVVACWRCSCCTKYCTCCPLQRRRGQWYVVQYIQTRDFSHPHARRLSAATIAALSHILVMLRTLETLRSERQSHLVDQICISTWESVNISWTATATARRSTPSTESCLSPVSVGEVRCGGDRNRNRTRHPEIPLKRQTDIHFGTPYCTWYRTDCSEGSTKVGRGSYPMLIACCGRVVVHLRYSSIILITLCKNGPSGGSPTVPDACFRSWMPPRALSGHRRC